MLINNYAHAQWSTDSSSVGDSIDSIDLGTLIKFDFDRFFRETHLLNTDSFIEHRKITGATHLLEATLLLSTSFRPIEHICQMMMMIKIHLRLKFLDVDCTQ